MKPTSTCSRLLRRSRWLGMLAVVAAPSAQAVNQEIRALFTPDSANPQRNLFVNKTPVSGYCADYPSECRDNETFSIRLPMHFESARPMQPNASPRNSAMFSIPALWRPLTVTNRETGETETVEVRIAGFGSRYILSDTAVNLTGAATAIEGHRALWGGPGGGWVNAAPPCTYSGVGMYSDNYYRFFWKTPVQGTCVKTASFPIPAMTYDYLDFSYELKTPNPLTMSSGLYTGDLSYRIGPGGDFDMGDVMLPTDRDLTLNFVLDVQHTLKVDIPPGGEKVQLVPAGGWQSWLQAGRRPVRLFRDQTFNISASSRFKMLLECEISAFPYDCVILDSVSRRSVELQVSVSLPNGLTDLAGQPVKRRRLRAGPANAQQFQPGFYVDRAPGILHFEIPPNQMEFMIQPGAASTYRGNVTVIWDSEV
ncbi:Exported protein [Pseudomonas sp. IT-P4]